MVRYFVNSNDLWFIVFAFNEMAVQVDLVTMAEFAQLCMYVINNGIRNVQFLRCKRIWTCNTYNTFTSGICTCELLIACLILICVL